MVVWGQAVLALCEEEGKRQQSTLEQDKQLLGKAHLLSPRALLAAQFRAEKKAVLAACTRWCQKRLSKLGSAAAAVDKAAPQTLTR